MITYRIPTVAGTVVLHFVTREDWGGGPVRSGYQVDPARFVRLVVHHTVMVLRDYDGDGFRHGDLDDVYQYMRALQTARPDLGPEVPYSFVIFAGSHPLEVFVVEGRGRGRTGAHTAGQNSTAYGVAYAGNTQVETVTPGMEEGVRWVGRTQLVDPANARPTDGHWQSKATACQGRNGKAVQARQQPPFTLGVTDEENDMNVDQARMLDDLHRVFVRMPVAKHGNVNEGNLDLGTPILETNGVVTTLRGEISDVAADLKTWMVDKLAKASTTGTLSAKEVARAVWDEVQGRR